MGHQERAELREQARLLSRQGEGPEIQRIARWMTFVEAWMADIDQALTDLATAISGVASRVQTDLENLQAEITTLQNAGGADTTQLQAIADQLEQNVAALNAIDPAAAVTPPADTPTYYTYSGDVNPGDQNGANISNWALVPNVTTDAGLSLYTFSGDPTTVDTTAWTVYSGATETTPTTVPGTGS